MTAWRKSSHSFSNGNCAEVTAWRTSSHSYGAGECVQVADGILVRDSKLGDGSPVVAFTAAAWQAFTSGVKDGAA